MVQWLVTKAGFLVDIFRRAVPKLYEETLLALVE